MLRIPVEPLDGSQHREQAEGSGKGRRKNLCTRHAENIVTYPAMHQNTADKGSCGRRKEIPLGTKTNRYKRVPRMPHCCMEWDDGCERWRGFRLPIWRAAGSARAVNFVHVSLHVVTTVQRAHVDEICELPHSPPLSCLTGRCLLSLQPGSRVKKIKIKTKGNADK